MKNRTFQSRSTPRRRRRGRTRLFVLGAAFAASVSTATPAAASEPTDVEQAPLTRGVAVDTTVRRFDIAEAPLSTVLAEFERITGIRTVLTDPGLGMIVSPGVTGDLTAVQAMQRLLMGTSVGATFARDRVTLGVGGVTEFVQVEGEGPVVQSPKLTAPLRDIPQTVSVIPQAVIQQQGATTLRDVLRNVPGITFQAGEGGGGLPGDNFTIRGFSAGNDMFVDGIRDTGGYSRDAFNLEQVEVAKGPSSSIAGRGATGGAINQVTKSPHMQESYAGSIGFGNADYGRGTLDLNQPLGSAAGGAAVRLSAMWTDAGVPGRDVVENRSWGVAPSVAFGLASPTQVTLKYQHLEQDNVPDYGLPWGSSPGFPTGAFQATPAVDQSNFYGLRDYDFEDIQSDFATADVAHRFSSTLSLRNTTRYSETDRDSAITSPRPPNRQLQRRTMGNGNIANQTNVTLAIGRARVRHDLVAGVEFSRETTSNQNSAQSVNQPAVSILDPDPGERPFGPMPDNTGNPSETRLNQAGAYLFDTLHFGERWQASGGARWDSVDVDYSQTTLTTGEVTRLESSNGMLSWRAGLVFKPKPEGSVYVGYGTSFNPSVDAAATGAALSNAPTAANNPSLDSEETRNVEIGTKWDALESRLSLTAALFRTTKLNARTRNAASDPFVLTGEQQVQGVELGVSGTIAPGWTAYAAYAFMDSEIAASANAAEEGQSLTLTPERTFNVWSTFLLPWEMTVGGGAQYMDAVFRNTTNTTSVPSYWLVNGLVSQRVTRNLTLRVNAQNLGDEEYVDRVGGGHYIPGPRRQVTVNADFGF